MAKNVNVATMPETIATSSRALAVSSSNFEQLKKNLTDVYENRAKLRKQLTKVKFNYFITYIFSSSEKRQDKKNLINELAKSLENAYINLNFRKGMKDAGSWDEAIYYFQELFQCCKIWDLTSRQDTDKFRQRTQLCRRYAGRRFAKWWHEQSGWWSARYEPKSEWAARRAGWTNGRRTG